MRLGLRSHFIVLCCVLFSLVVSPGGLLSSTEGVRQVGTDWILEGPNLRVVVHKGTMAVDVTDKVTHTTWKMSDNGKHDLTIKNAEGMRELSLGGADAVITPTRRGHWLGIAVRFTYLPIKLDVLLQPRLDEVSFRLSPTQEDRVVFAAYPRPFDLPQSPDAMSIIPVQEGFLLPGDYKFPVSVGHRAMARVTGLETYQKLSMPWWGQVQGPSSVMAFLETPDDATVYLRHPAGGPTELNTLWLPSLGFMRYPRRVVYIFRPHWNYVSMVEYFRHWMQQHGEWRTLTEKAKANPRINDFRGAVHINAMAVVNITEPIRIPGLPTGKNRQSRRYYHVDSFSSIAKWMSEVRKEYAIDRAVLQLYGWSVCGADNMHPDNLPPNKAAGGVTGLDDLSRMVRALGYQLWLHVDFNDIYEAAPSFNPRLLVKEENGDWPHVDAWAGGPSSNLCPLEAMYFIKRNLTRGYGGAPGILSMTAVDGLFLDTYPVDFECFDPAHKMTRSEDHEAMIRQFQYISAKGLETSVENWDWYTVPYETDLWATQFAGYPFPKDANHLEGIPVPLFNLAFHDCLLIGFNPNREKYYHFLSPSTVFLYGLLYGDMLNLPLKEARYVPISGNSVYLINDSSRAKAVLKKELLMTRLHRCVAFDQMTNYQMNPSDPSVQESTFSSGVEVRVNFKTDEYQITGCGGISSTKHRLNLPASWEAEMK